MGEYLLHVQYAGTMPRSKLFDSSGRYLLEEAINVCECRKERKMRVQALEDVSDALKKYLGAAALNAPVPAKMSCIAVLESLLNKVPAGLTRAHDGVDQALSVRLSDETIRGLLTDGQPFYGDVQELPSSALVRAANAFTKFYSTSEYKEARVFLKPAYLGTFLQLMQTRFDGEGVLLIGKHCTSDDAIQKIGRDPTGHCFEHAGMQGEAQGRGVYVSLNETACNSYNKTGQAGRGLLVAVIVPSDLSKVGGTMKFYKLGSSASSDSESSSDHDAVVVYDINLVYTLGDLKK